MYLTGPAGPVMDAIENARGTGYVVQVDLPDGAVWIEFYGCVLLTLDEQFLAMHPEVEFGVTAGFAGGGMVVVPEVDGVLSGRAIYVEAGMLLETPLARMKVLLDQDLELHTSGLHGGPRTSVRYDRHDGLLDILQQTK